MLLQGKKSTSYKCDITTLLPKGLIIFVFLMLGSLFSFTMLPTDPSTYERQVPQRTRQSYQQRFSSNVVSMDSINKYGLTVGTCARDAVYADLRGTALNRRAEVPYTGKDILKMVRPPYLNDYMNPCWVDERTERLRCLPYFIIAGAAESGTTNLYWSMNQHPQVELPKPKEPHWWAEQSYRSPLDTYIKSYDETTSIIQSGYRMVNGRNLYNIVTGDGSQSTGSDFFRWKSITQNKNCTGEPGVMTPHLLKHIIPQVKVIFILRNPADRLLAEYIQWRGKEPTNPEHFHEQCVLRLKEYRDCREQHSDRYCTYNPSHASNVSTARELLQRSMYPVFIKDWLSIFPREQFHFVQFEDYVQNKAKVLKRIFAFLDLDSLTADDIKRTMVTTGINDHKFKMAPMLKDTRRMLDDFFKPYNEELAALIGDPIFKFLNTQIPQNDPSGKKEVLRKKNDGRVQGVPKGNRASGIEIN